MTYCLESASFACWLACEGPNCKLRITNQCNEWILRFWNSPLRGFINDYLITPQIQNLPLGFRTGTIGAAHSTWSTFSIIPDWSNLWSSFPIAFMDNKWHRSRMMKTGFSKGLYFENCLVIYRLLFLKYLQTTLMLFSNCSCVIFVVLLMTTICFQFNLMCCNHSLPNKDGPPFETTYRGKCLDCFPKVTNTSLLPSAYRKWP